jgi:hypothetical protein
MSHVSPTMPRDQFFNDALQRDAMQWVAGMLNSWWHIVQHQRREPAATGVAIGTERDGWHPSAACF